MSQKRIKPMNLITDSHKPVIKKQMEGVYTANLLISGMIWFETGKGTVIIDTLVTIPSAERVVGNIREKIKYIIYTHGHADHVGGASVFMKDKPEVIANRFLPDRFDRYQFLRPYRNLISAMQFNIPKQAFERGLESYIYPTKTFLGDYSFNLGKYTFELHTARAETDDAVWVYVPELKTAIIGDLMIGSFFPNIGNPWKPTRYALDWAKELERIRALNPEFIFCNGGGYRYEGKEAMNALNANIEVIRSLHDQVVQFINEGMPITEMIHKVKVPEHLDNSPYLKQLYSRPEFFVYNVYRWYHGYYDHNPAHLIPRPEKEVMQEIYSLIGDRKKLIDRVNILLERKEYQLALQILDILLQSEPNDIEALQLRIKLVKKITEDDSCLMSRNAYFYSINQDKTTLRKIRRKNQN